jgi:hypothetical protein
LELIIDDILNWKEHLKDVKARAGKEQGLLRTLAHKKWVGDQKTLLRIHKMIVLSTLRYGESIYGTATKPALNTLETIHNTGVKLAFGVFVICETEMHFAKRAPNARGNERTEHNNCSNTNTHE